MGGIARQLIRVAAACALAVTLSPPVAAAPADLGLAEAPTLSLQSLGAGNAVDLYGVQDTHTLTVPVPRGLVPVAANAVVELPPYIGAGSLVVTQDERTISRVDLPPGNLAPISIPLAGADVRDNAMSVLIRSFLVPPQDRCLVDTSVPLRLANMTIAYEGVEVAPGNVAEFLPPVLSRVAIFIPETPTQAEADAAVRLTAAVVARYGGQSSDVDVLALPGDDTTVPPTRSLPLERQIVVKERPGAGVALQPSNGVPALLITGSGPELVNQSRLLGSNLATLALASKAVAGTFQTAPMLPPDRITIRDLGQPGVNATGLSPQVLVGLDQTRLGRSADDVRVHLQGSYTPLPSNVGGEVVVTVGSDTIDHWPVDASGRIDRWVSVPDRVLQRYTNLGVAVNISGDLGPCGQFQPIKLTIDGGTLIESRAADPPHPAGFQSLPQALLPRTQIGVGLGEPGAFADTARAAAIVEGLQRLGALPVDTAVVSRNDALASDQHAIVISPDGWNDQPIALPVSAAGEGALQFAALESGAPATLSLNPGLRYGTLQTVVDDGRTVLIATSNGAVAELDSLLDWLDADPRRWSRLSGDAVLGTPGQEPVVVAVPAPPADAAEAERPSRTGWIVGGVAGLAVVAVVAGLVVSRRRRRTPAEG